VAPLVQEIADAFARSGTDLAAGGRAWGRAAPTRAIVPAFGLRALPAPARAVLGLALAAAIFPALAPAATSGAPWLIQALVEIARGLPIALAAAVPLWAATMAGGMADALRGAQDSLQVATVEGRTTPLGVLLSLLACSIFHATGGAAKLASALATPSLPEHPLLAAAHDLTAGIALAVALGGPLLAASIVLEVTCALIARAASPAHVHALLAPLRALGVLGVAAIALDRIAAAFALALPAR
jgi:type III secretory pathway component EscT